MGGPNNVDVCVHLHNSETGARIAWAETLTGHEEPTVSVILSGVNIFFHRSGQIEQLRAVLAEAAERMKALEQASGGERRMGSGKDYCDTDDVARIDLGE